MDLMTYFTFQRPVLLSLLDDKLNTTYTIIGTVGTTIESYADRLLEGFMRFGKLVVYIGISFSQKQNDRHVRTVQ